MPDRVIPGRLPLFPLPNAVLFPGMPMPLHIFEPRYRKLVADALEGERFIGMVLLRPGWEADYDGRPPVYECGCAGALEQCQPLPDGRYALVLRGVSRFRIQAEHPGEPYRIASVAPLDDALGEGDLTQARGRLMQAVGRTGDGSGLIGLRPDIPDAVFVNALCQSMTLTPIERQSLLDCDSILARYLRLVEILEFKRLESSSGSGGVH